MIEYEHADLASNARLLSEYNTTNSLCLFPTTVAKLKFTIPTKNWDEVNILTSINNFLDDSLKIILLTMFVVLPPLVCILNYISGCRQSFFDGLTLNFLNYFAIMNFVSVKMPLSWPSRYVIGAIAVVWLIVGNTFSGKIVEFLNADLGLKDIKNIDELMRSKLIIKVPYPMAILFEGNYQNASSSHKLLNKAVEKARRLEKVGDSMAFIDVHNMGEMIKSRKYAMLYLDNIIDHLEKKFFDTNGNNLLTHLDESPYEYYYATSVPRTSPFVNRFNEILMRIFEAGLSKYQMMLAMIENDLIYIRRIKAGQVPNNELKSLSTCQMKSIFILYSICIGGCVGVFVSEIIFHKFLRIFKTSNLFSVFST